MPSFISPYNIERMEVDDNTEAPSWPGASTCSKDERHEKQSSVHCSGSSGTVAPDEKVTASSSMTSTTHRNFNQELAQLIVVMCPKPTMEGLSGEELAEAFQDAPEIPPVTRQSLCELDIQNIMNNIRLRHDVNFDRDLSFRPNLDGSKGQEKGKAAKKYWTALTAELILYEGLSQESFTSRDKEREQIVQHARRRIPILFETVRDVLKSLVPERDHTRVDEHLDIPLLMQAIGRGVCDLVRLAEWMAQLLKEHCAPMRDVWVDSMVERIRSGVSCHSPGKLVEGLRALLGVLEAMKLDIANHQIRNLKTPLVEETINFERHYHLDRLVRGRPRVDIKAAQAWFANAVEEFHQHCASNPQNTRHLQLEIFARAISATLFCRVGRSEFPDTLYLDQERLQSLKSEIEDLICFDICLDLFKVIVKGLGYQGQISPITVHQLRTAISAIMHGALGHGSQQWVVNSENLSLEILRQASCLIGQQQAHHFSMLSKINHQLCQLLLDKNSHHAVVLENSFLPQILAGARRHSTSSPMELFSSLVSSSPSTPPPSAYPPPSITVDTFVPGHLQHEATKMADIANRITHIIVLHWRVWGSIAYVPEEEESSLASHTNKDASLKALPRTHSVQSPTTCDQEAQAVTSMKTGDAPESGPESQIARQTSSR